MPRQGWRALFGASRATRRLFWALLVAVSMLAPPAAAGPATLQAQMDRMYRPWTQGAVPGCAAGVMEQGRWQARGGYGAADVQGGARINSRTAFYAASVSKQFTAAAVLRLVDLGRATLDDDIRAHIPEWPATPQPITLRHLLHHTSGIVDFVDLLERAGTLHAVNSADSVLHLLMSRSPAFPAGQVFSYSNSNYFLLAEIIRRASGRSLRTFANEELFAPLGMKNTRFRDDPADVTPRDAPGYTEERRAQPRLVTTAYAQVGGGGLLTTIDDLGRWARVFDDANAIPGSPALGQRLLQRGRLADGGVIDYAFGLSLENEAGLEVAGHLGRFPGFTASFDWVPSRRIVIAVLCNSSDIPIQPIRDTLRREALRRAAVGARALSAGSRPASSARTGRP